MKNKRKSLSLNKKCRGAAVVELSYTLFFLVGLVIVSYELMAVFGVKQQLNYASYIGERSNVVDGTPVATVNVITEGRVEVGQEVKVTRFLDLPVNLNNPWGGGNLNFEVSSAVDMPDEPVDSGDNVSR